MSGSRDRITLIGKESVGKSALAAGLTGLRPTDENVGGTTVSSEVYRTDGFDLVDTPGITLEADTETTREALAELGATDRVVLVVPATDLDRDLEDLLPLVEGRPGAMVVTHWDRVDVPDERETIASLESDLGVPVVPVDARRLTRVAADGGMAPDADPAAGADAGSVLEALRYAGLFPAAPTTRPGWEIEPSETILERPYLGPIASALVLLLPAVVAVWFANTVAGELVVEPAPVEAVGERVFAHQGAHLGQLVFQFLDAAFGQQRGVALVNQLVVRAPVVGLRAAGFVEQAFENAVELRHVFGAPDALDVGADLALVFVVGGQHVAEAADEGGHGGLQRGGGLAQAVLDHALLVDHFLEPLFGFLQRLDLERAGDDFLHHVELAAQPGVVVQQLADVFHQQQQDALERFLLVMRVGGLQLDADPQVFQPRCGLEQGGGAGGLAYGDGQLLGLFHQARIVRELRGDAEF
ncbi:FeoB small GTPase domain-containing protein, partial [Natronococcus sp.]|uniref:FeoB small GTPase domain-containing protein n=1 Tax=Natronococcus sp. TaxID=35747 RepID=UPI003A4D75FB